MIEVKGKSVEEVAAQIVQLSDGYTDFMTKTAQPQLWDLVLGVRTPQRYAEIFRAVANHPSASNWMRYAALAEDINGRRRMNGANILEIVGQSQKLMDEIAQKLVDSRDKYTLLGANWWNQAIMCRNLRENLTAADAGRQSASWYGLAGNVEQMFNGLFEVEVEEANYAFSIYDHNLIRKKIRAMVLVREHAISKFGAETDWMSKNTSAHIGIAAMMAILAKVEGISAKDFQADFQKARNSGMQHWDKAFDVWDDYLKRRYRKVIAADPVHVNSSSYNNMLLCWQVMIACAERELAQIDKARERLRFAADFTGINGIIPISVASHMLSDLTQVSSSLQ